MSKEITIQDLVDKVKSELFYLQKGTDREIKKVYPLFFVDQVELEIGFEVTKDAQSGFKIIIPQLIEGSLTGGQENKTANKMRITLSPILSREELRELIKDERLMNEIKEASLLALRKGDS